MRGATHDTAKQAALDEAARMGLKHPVPRYVVGRIVEAALAAIGHPTPTQPDTIDCEGWEDE